MDHSLIEHLAMICLYYWTAGNETKLKPNALESNLDFSFKGFWRQNIATSFLAFTWNTEPVFEILRYK
jgi:hypothetical protein